MRTRPLPRNFASGELAPWYDGLATEITQKGCRTLENFIVKKQGQATRRPGTYFVAETKDSSNGNDYTALIIPVVIDNTNRYCLEFGHQYIRFHSQTTHAVLGAPYEVATPYAYSYLVDLKWTYKPGEKALYLWHWNYAPRRLVWTSDTEWSLEFVSLIDSPPIVAMTTSGKLAYSEDGIKWTEKKIKAKMTSAIQKAIGRGESNLIEADAAMERIGDFGGDEWIDNGSLLGGGSINAIRGTRQGELVAVGLAASGGSGLLYVSNDDGMTWDSKTPGGAGALMDCRRNEIDHEWMAVGLGMRRYTYALDAASWVSITETGNLYGVACQDVSAAAAPLWLACGDQVIKYVTSSVAAPWTSIAMSSSFRAITHCIPTSDITTQVLWLAVGTDSTGTKGVIFSSQTGSVWTQRYNGSGVIACFNDVAWIGHMAIAVGGIGWGTLTEGANGIFTSPDGITWTQVVMPSRAHGTAWQKIAYHPNNIGPAGSDVLYLNTDNYPEIAAFHEGRLAMVPYESTNAKTNLLMGSRVGKPTNFYIGEFSDDAYSYEITGEDNVDIQWLMSSNNGLVIGTRTAEGLMIGSPDEGITPQTAQMKWLSTFGSANIQPVRVHDMIVFIQRGGETVRGYVPQQGAYQSPELTAYADHIAAGGILSLDHQADPQSMVWANRADGQALALTMDNGMRAWARIKPASTSLSVGMIESMAIIPTTGAEDEIWLLVNRKVAAGTKRYIEYMDTLAVASFAAAHYVDSGVYKTSGTTFQVVGALTHLAGENVDAFISAPAANIRWIAGLTVAASGTINTAPYSGTDMHVGLPYTSYLQTMRGDYGSAWGDGAGLEKRTTNVLAWVHDSSALAKFGPTQALATETIPYSSSVGLNTEICVVNFPGQFDRDNYLWCIVTDPRPFTLVAILPDSETGDH